VAWTLAFGQPEDRTPTHGYEPTREAAMAAFAKSWPREIGKFAFGGKADLNLACGHVGL
jgi:hypothetical protein